MQKYTVDLDIIFWNTSSLSLTGHESGNVSDRITSSESNTQVNYIQVNYTQVN